MKKLIVITALVALASLASTAKADPVAGMTCGNNGPGHPIFTSQLFHNNDGSWTADYDNNCGQGKTFMLEIQYSNDGGNHWFDATGHTIKTSGACGGGCPMTLTNKTLACSNSLDYQAKVWSYQNVYDRTLGWLGC